MKARSTTDAAARVAVALMVFVLGDLAVRADEDSAFRAAARVLQERCTACHSGPKPEAGLNLETGHLYRSTVNVPSRTRQGLLLVDPGHPETSALYLKLLTPDEGRYRGPRMPMHASTLGSEELAVVKDWIAAFPAATWNNATPGSVESAETLVAPPTFQDSHLANLPTPDTLGGKGLEIRILHRFKSAALTAGSHNLYGIDGGAWISIGVAAGIGDHVDVGIQRTNLLQDWEVYSKWGVVRQRPGGSPLSLSLVGSLARASASGTANPDRAGLQVIVARRLGERLSLMLVPAVVTRTNFNDASDRRGTAALGFGGEWRLNSYLALTTEWIGQLGGVEAPFASGSVGFSIGTSRHVFHLLVTNTPGAQSDLYAPGGDLDWRKHQFRLGFNISRTFDRSEFRRHS